MPGLITSLSILSADFPATEVEYADLIGIKYVVHGRTVEGGMDCLGIVLEILRRAGLGFPDPKTTGNILDFQELFDPVDTPDVLYDLAHVSREGERDRVVVHHVMIVVRPGLLLAADATRGVHTAQVTAIQKVRGAEFFRVNASFLPI